MQYAIYCRRSSDEKSEKQTQSIADQINRCLDYAKNNGLEIMAKPTDFSDFESPEELLSEDNDNDLNNRRTYHKTRDLFIVKESFTAKIPHKRKKWRKLISYINKGKVIGLLSYSPDRQARNILEGGELINFVDEDKIDLKYTNFHFENTASGKMMLGVWFVFAKQYSDAISENVLRGNDETVNRGKGLGYYKYGYRRREDGYYEPETEKFELIQTAFQMKIIEKKSDKEIANRLNDNGWTQKRGDNIYNATANKINKIWKDTFYYGIFCVADRISDQIADNPYYKPIITKEEYEILADRRDVKKTPIAMKKIKDEYSDIRCIPRDMLESLDGYSVTCNLPSKNKRFLPKLVELQKIKHNATLRDVVKSNQIRYGVKQKLSKYCGLEITGKDIEDAVINKLKTLTVTEETYKDYVNFMKDQLQKLYDDTSEQMNIIMLRINNTRSELSKYVEKHMGLKKDKIEEEVYHNKKKELEGKIDRLTKEHGDTQKTERHTIAEYEMFFDIMNRAGEYYQRANYVQKAKISEIFFLNMVLDNEKGLHIAVKPIFEGLFISNGADNETRTRSIFLGKEVH